MGGYFALRKSTGAHDDLYAKAIVLDSGVVKAALVSCDLESVPAAIVRSARAEIERTVGIPGQDVLISATHTHTGPETSPIILGWADSATASVAREYFETLPGKITEAVRRAEANLAPARAWAGKGREDSLSFNRRFLMKDGTVRFNPGKLNPEIVRPVGPIDPEVAVVFFDSPENKPLATHVNFALHLDTVGGTEFSADYPFTLAKLLSAAKSPELLMTQFTIGAAGNINHLDVHRAAPQSGHTEAARIGTILAAAVLKAFGKLQSVPSAPLRVRRRIVSLPLHEFDPGEVGKARELVRRAQIEGPDVIPFLELVHAFKVLDASRYQSNAIEAEVLVIALGKEVAWVGLPGEVFVELGLAIKQASPFAHTIVVELAHDSINYVPNRKAFAEGGYEAVNSLCKPGCGETLVEAATKLLVETYWEK